MNDLMVFNNPDFGEIRTSAVHLRLRGFGEGRNSKWRERRKKVKEHG